MKEFNIGDCVNIKLTEEGIAILKSRYETLGGFEPPEVDENGYTQMPLWEVMQIFGNYMYNSNPQLPFEMNIAISEKYLHDQEKGKCF